MKSCSRASQSGSWQLRVMYCLCSLTMEKSYDIRICRMFCCILMYLLFGIRDN